LIIGNRRWVKINERQTTARKISTKAFPIYIIFIKEMVSTRLFMQRRSKMLFRDPSAIKIIHEVLEIIIKENALEICSGSPGL
jgi:hypothetical protein